MRYRIPVLCSFALAAFMTTAAHADTYTFDFSFTGSLFSGSGSFTTTYEGANQYLITGITGDVDGSAITGLLAPGSFPKGFLEVPNDNILIYPGELLGTKYFDNKGVSFSLADGNDVNLNDTLGFETAVGGTKNNLYTEFDLVCVSPSDPTPAVPEPSTFALLGTGLLGFAGAVRRRLAL